MASLTVRGLDEDVKHRLRVRAATKGLSLEEEVRRILADAVANENTRARPSKHWVDEITDIVDAVGGIDLELPPRDSNWEPPDFSDFPLDPPEPGTKTSGRSDK